jgi:hypothetical protein
MRIGLRTRLLLLALLLLVPVFVVAFVNARDTRSESTRDVRENVRLLAEPAATVADDRVEAARQLLLGDVPPDDSRVGAA